PHATTRQEWMRSSSHLPPLRPTGRNVKVRPDSHRPAARRRTAHGSRIRATDHGTSATHNPMVERNTTRLYDRLRPLLRVAIPLPDSKPADSSPSPFGLGRVVLWDLHPYPPESHNGGMGVEPTPA